jgi:hypothetical protein
MRIGLSGSWSIAVFLVAAGAISAAVPVAHADAQHSAPATAGSSSTLPESDVDAAAAAAIVVVERFTAALVAGQIDQAAAHLDPAVIVRESGGIEQSRDEYLASHARADAEFLKDAEITLKRRRAQSSCDLAWVASESAIRVKRTPDAPTIDSTETMVLRKAGTDWKIVHIHWSSRRADARSSRLEPMAGTDG